MIKEVVIIGAGISGLTSAFYLESKNKSFAILEEKPYAGGVLQTKIKDGFVVEKGPNTILLSDKRTEIMFNKLGLKIENAAPKSKKRFIVKNKKCIPLPLNLWQLIYSNLFSLKSKFQILRESFNRKKSLLDEESISQFFIRRFGKEILDYAVNPFIAGTYAGNPDSLSIEHSFPKIYEIEKKYKSVIGGFLKKIKRKNNLRLSPNQYHFLVVLVI